MSIVRRIWDSDLYIWEGELLVCSDCSLMGEDQDFTSNGYGMAMHALEHVRNGERVPEYVIYACWESDRMPWSTKLLPAGAA